jgi:hypothetical protein
LGPAGSGKSTELRRYAATQAAALLDGDLEVPLPISIAARDLNETNVDWRALARSLAAEHDDNTITWLERRLHGSPAVLLVDGLDEVPASTRAVFEDQLVDLIALNPELRVIVSSRDDVRLAHRNGWQTARLEPLDAEAIADWLSGAGLDPERFMPMVATGPLAELASNPLSLQFLTELFLREGALPTVRITELARMIVDHRLGHWDYQRGIARDVTVSTDVLHRFMTTLAARMTRDQRVVVDTSTMLEVATEVLGTVRRRPVDPLALLGPGLERSGLLRGGGPAGADYSFVHELFHDYFAGSWLVEQALAPAQLAEYAMDPVWQAAVVHALVLLSPREFEPAFDRIWEAVDSEPAPQRWAVRRIALQGGLQRTNPRLRKQVLDRGFEAVAQGRQDGEPPQLWNPVEQLLASEDDPR